MGVFVDGLVDRQYRGWGCLTLQAVAGAVCWAFFFSSEPGHYRYGKAGLLLVASGISLAVVVRLAINLVELFAAHPRAGTAVLLAVIAAAVAVVVVTQRRGQEALEAGRAERARQFAAVRVGTTVAQAEALLGPHTGEHFSPPCNPHAHKCLRTSGSPGGAARYLTWQRPDGHEDRFVAFDAAGVAVYTCLAAPCVAWEMSGKECIRYDP